MLQTLVMNGSEGVVGSSMTGLLVVVQLVSSLLKPSLQSSSPSHLQDRNMHFLCAHLKKGIRIKMELKKIIT